MRYVTLLGATGSIGVSCLDVLREYRSEFGVYALVAHRRWELLAAQCREFQPEIAVIADASLAGQVDRQQFPANTRLLFGPDAICEVAAAASVQIVVSAIVGAAGLAGTWAAVAAGKRVAIANKETLVIAGPLITALAQQTKAELLPVDSEHSAIFQCLQAGRRSEVKQLILTASGGPFRGYRREQLEAVTVEQALHHPTWTMGPKITVDSATMMNKGLEVIEARWLFGFPVEQISVVIHPQSIVHSLVEYVDGAVIAQLSPPDMKLPIQYALSYPARWPGTSPVMDWSQRYSLEFMPPDLDLFAALRLSYDAARRGGTAGAVLNAANEVAVARFLAGDLAFLDVPRACQAVLEQHNFSLNPSLDELLQLDLWARQELSRWRN